MDHMVTKNLEVYRIHCKCVRQKHITANNNWAYVSCGYGYSKV